MTDHNDEHRVDTPNDESGTNQTHPDAAAQPAAHTVPMPENPFANTAATTPLPDVTLPNLGGHTLPQQFGSQAPQGAPSFGSQGHYGHPSQQGAAFGFGAQQVPGSHAPQDAYSQPPRAKRDGGKRGAGALVGALVLAALVGGAAGFGGAWAGNTVFKQDAATSSSSNQRAVTINNPDSVNQVTAVATKVMPSVVTIQAQSSSSGGSGSGVVLSEDGYVLTNTHVVTLDGASGNAALRVSTSDGRLWDAEVVGTDPTYDLAVIKLKGASGLTPIEFADSSKINVGDQAIALGAPLGLDNTVTQGIVSAMNRSIQIQSSAAPKSTEENKDEGQGENNGQGPFQFDLPGRDKSQSAAASISISVIQTDAAINPGNSGGALVNGDGKLIGINVAIASAGGSSDSSSQSGNIGVGFSIPSNIAERISQEIIKNGSATHGLLGAEVTSAENVRGATVEGASISKVSAGGAAEAAGLQSGDVVTKFDGKPISSAVDLTAQVRALAAGADAKLTYVRNGQEHEADVKLGTLTQ